VEPPLVSVVITTLDRRWYLERTIESVRRELAAVDHEIVVVDGGSVDGTGDWLVRQKDVITIVQHNRSGQRRSGAPRRSWGAFTNLGFRAASGRFVCMLSDDCLIVPGAIASGVSAFGEDDARVGAVAFYWRNWPEDERYRVGVTFGGRLFVNHGLFRHAALRDVGFADEDAFSFYHADGDLALRLDAAGWKCVDAPNSFVEHYSHANVPLRRSNAERQPADWAAYVGRWGGLGVPEADWLERDFRDPARTAERYWGHAARRRVRVARYRSHLAYLLSRVRRAADVG